MTNDNHNKSICKLIAITDMSLFDIEDLVPFVEKHDNFILRSFSNKIVIGFIGNKIDTQIVKEELEQLNIKPKIKCFNNEK